MSPGDSAAPTASVPLPVALPGSLLDSFAPVLVCFAVRDEARFFRPPPRVQVLLTAMGPQVARAAVERTLARMTVPPRLVLTCGFAGGLDPHLEAGAILYDSDPLPELVRVLEQGGARRGRFHGADRVAVRALEKQALHRQTGADAVEMESSVIRALCRRRNIPSATVRVISDTAQEDLPLDFNALMTPAGGLRWGALAVQILLRPGKIRGLLHLQKQSSEASRRLSAVIQGVFAGGA